MVLLGKDFRWRTMEGEVLTLPEMSTSHIFNSMKMLFNHLAVEWGGKPVWMTKSYGDYLLKAESKKGRKEMALLVCVFVMEIDRRGDLPDRYKEPYQEIVEQIQTLPMLRQAQKQLEAPQV